MADSNAQTPPQDGSPMTSGPGITIEETPEPANPTSLAIPVPPRNAAQRRGSASGQKRRTSLPVPAAGSQAKELSANRGSPERPPVASPDRSRQQCQLDIIRPPVPDAQFGLYFDIVAVHDSDENPDLAWVFELEIPRDLTDWDIGGTTSTKKKGKKGKKAEADTSKRDAMDRDDVPKKDTQAKLLFGEKAPEGPPSKKPARKPTWGKDEPGNDGPEKDLPGQAGKGNTLPTSTTATKDVHGKKPSGNTVSEKAVPQKKPELVVDGEPLPEKEGSGIETQQENEGANLPKRDSLEKAATNKGTKIATGNDAASQDQFRADKDLRDELKRSKRVNWLRDDNMLPAAIPEARVLSFSYPPTVHSSEDPLEYLASELLSHLEQKRQDRPSSNRPILFIGHGVGGTIIQKALATAVTNVPESNDRPTSKSVLAFTAGVVFLDTPLLGLDASAEPSKDHLAAPNFMESAKSKLAKSSRDARLVREVKQDLETLKKLLEAFTQVVKDPTVSYQGIPVISFHTQTPTSTKPQLKTNTAESTRTMINTFKIVGDMSSQDASKFTGPDDGDFLKVRNVIVRFLKARRLFDAAATDQREVVDTLLNEEFETDIPDEFGRTALHMAVLSGSRQTARLLLGKGQANIAHRDNKGLTALHHAVIKAAGNTQTKTAEDVIRLLLEKGAEVEALDNDSKTAWDHTTSVWVSKLRKHRALIRGPSKPVPPKLEEPKPPRSGDEKTACENFIATIAEFYYIGEEEQRIIERPSIYELLYEKDRGPHAILEDARDPKVHEDPKCRWYHIPANNETWVQDLFAKLGVLDDSMKGQRHEGFTPHSRYMWPQAKKYERPKHYNAETQSHENTKVIDAHGMVLFMPYLSFETSEGRRNISKTVKKSYPKPSPKNDEEKYDMLLIKAYEKSLHPRRTLDQFYYYMLDDTDARDEDQVVHKWAMKQRSRRKTTDTPVLMVDQLWLWVLNEDTVITSFPETWGQVASYDVLERFFEYLRSDKRSPIRSVHDLVALITTHCSNAFNDYGPSELQFHDVFESSINHVANEETKLFGDFRTASEELNDMNKNLDSDERIERRDKLFDITNETTQLTDIKDIRDELNIVLTVLKEQKDVLTLMTHEIISPRVDAFEGDYHERVMKEKVVSIVDNNIKNVTKMDEHAKNTYDALNHLLDLKQKQANSWEARFAREGSEQTAKQGNTILVFTIVTIVFAPLSFMASFFALSIAQFPRNPKTGNPSWELGHISAYLFGVSIAVSVPFIFIALNVNRVKEVWKLRSSWGRRKHVLNEDESEIWIPSWRWRVRRKLGSIWNHILCRGHTVYEVDSDGEEIPDSSGRWRGFHIRIPFFSRWAGMRYYEDEDEIEYPWRRGLRKAAWPVRWVFGSRRRRWIIDRDDEDVDEGVSGDDYFVERSSWYRRALRGMTLPVRRVFRSRNEVVYSDDEGVIVVDEESLEERSRWYHRRWWHRRSVIEVEDE